MKGENLQLSNRNDLEVKFYKVRAVFQLSLATERNQKRNSIHQAQSHIVTGFCVASDCDIETENHSQASMTVH